MKSDQGYKGVWINAEDLIIWAMDKTNDEVGLIMRQIVGSLKNKASDEILKHSFIDGIIKGTAKRTSLAPSVRKKVLAAGRCAFCGTTEKLTVDHIKPYSKGGTHDIENLQCLCLRCNITKSDKYE